MRLLTSVQPSEEEVRALISPPFQRVRGLSQVHVASDVKLASRTVVIPALALALVFGPAPEKVLDLAAVPSAERDFGSDLLRDRDRDHARVDPVDVREREGQLEVAFQAEGEKGDDTSPAQDFVCLLIERQTGASHLLPLALPQRRSCLRRDVPQTAVRTGSRSRSVTVVTSVDRRGRNRVAPEGRRASASVRAHPERPRLDRMCCVFVARPSRGVGDAAGEFRGVKVPARARVHREARLAADPDLGLGLGLGLGVLKQLIVVFAIRHRATFVCHHRVRSKQEEARAGQVLREKGKNVHKFQQMTLRW